MATSELFLVRHACGVFGTVFRALEWKAPIFSCERSRTLQTHRSRRLLQAARAAWYHEWTAELSGRRIFLKRHCDRTLGERAARLAGRLSWRKVRACPGRLRALSVSHGQSGLDSALCVSVTGS